MSETAPQLIQPAGSEDIAALARGGRTNMLGFLLRLLARLPFLFIAGRLYGLDAVGRYASALILIELVALVCSLGEKRGLAHRLTEGEGNQTNLVFDGLLVALIVSLLAGGLLWLVPAAMFPNGMNSPTDIWLLAAIPGFALTEIILAAQAYRHDVATSVRARAVVEPWTISIMLGAFYLYPPTREAALALAYIVSIYAAFFTAAISFLRTYGLPKGWRPQPRAMLAMVSRALPLTGADAVEWSTRRVDIFILGFFASEASVAYYFMAQQVASLPQKLKSSFEPILGPVITARLKEGDFAAIARQVRQVGFWIIAAQLGIALALGIPGEALMGLLGPQYVAGTGALAFLLIAEVVASMAVVSESVLVYLARKRNLAISLGVIALQTALTIAVIMLADRLLLDEAYKAAGAAMALMLALGISSLIKALLLRQLLGASVGNLRMALVWATAAAVAVGQVAILLPEWAELTFGVPAILIVYGWIIWHRGFGPDDRVLFSKRREK